MQIFSAKDIFYATISFVFEFAWQTNGKFGTEFAISLLRQAKSESKARFACHTERSEVSIFRSLRSRLSLNSALNFKVQIALFKIWIFRYAQNDKMAWQKPS